MDPPRCEFEVFALEYSITYHISYFQQQFEWAGKKKCIDITDGKIDTQVR